MHRVGERRAAGVNDPFLIDECLSPDLVALAPLRGHHATHVVFRALQGTDDPGLMPTITTEGFVLVTSNARDFLRLYARETVHPGLIVILPGNVTAQAQLRLFGLALDVVEPMHDLVNKLVEVSAAGQVSVRDWPSP